MALVAVGCGGSSGKNNPDAGTMIVTTCTPDAKTCVNNNVAAQCASDGKSLIAYSCNAGEVCTAGACVADPAVACTAAANTCMDGATALHCSATGKGFDVVVCPKNTACVDNGNCQGACTVGSSYCDNVGTVQTCTDGFSYTATTCPASQYCVDTNGPSYQTAACKASDCQPTVSNGCGGANTVCGNANDMTAPNQQTTVSQCVGTPTGYHWSTSTCTGGSVCSPTQNSCNNVRFAGCTETQCTPGQTSCYNDGYQTCGADGNWLPTVTACNAAGSTTLTTCISGPTGAICGDPACSYNNAGVCDSAGKYHTCGADGKVSTTATACTSGLCVPNGDVGTSSSYRPGQCVVQCQDGDQRCNNSGNGTTYETCAGGLWGAAKQCMATGGGVALCNNTTSTAGRPAIFCGECVNGATRCDGDQIQTCANNTWGADTACTVGVCQTNYNSNNTQTSVCRAQCIPGSLTCQGGGVQDPVSRMFGTTAVVACDQTGKLGAQTACDSGKLCRTGPSSNGAQSTSPDGIVLGCVTCVGGQNAFGLPDTRCSNADDTATNMVNGDGFVETCLPDSSGWDIAKHFQCVTPNNYCAPASYYYNLPTNTNPNNQLPFPASCGGDNTNNNGD
ncbi:MAG: hypothetical protein ABI321_01475 [Polyangia bacterium]